MPVADTAVIRRNISGLHTTSIPGVTPDNSKPLAWRKQAGWGYSDLTAPTVPEVEPPFVLEIIKFNLNIQQLETNTLEIMRLETNTLAIMKEDISNLTIQRDEAVAFNIVQLDEFNLET